MLKYSQKNTTKIRSICANVGLLNNWPVDFSYISFKETVQIIYKQHHFYYYRLDANNMKLVVEAGSDQQHTDLNNVTISNTALTTQSLVVRIKLLHSCNSSNN